MNSAHIDSKQAKPDATLAAHMEGEVRTQHLFHADQGNGEEIMLVVFSPGSRTRPHIHKQGQILFITEGTGIVAVETEKRVVHAGDVIVIPAGAWHWHGATREAGMSHVVVQGPGNDLVWEVEMRDWATGGNG